MLGAGLAATRALLAGGAVGIAVAVAASRVLLDDHWLSDVIAGLALGWAWFSSARSRSAAGCCASERPSRWPSEDVQPPRVATRASGVIFTHRGKTRRHEHDSTGTPREFTTTPVFEALAARGTPRAGSIYILIGVLAFRIAEGVGSQPASQQGALRTVAHQPFGHGSCWPMAIGLAGYALWGCAGLRRRDPRGG